MMWKKTAPRWEFRVAAFAILVGILIVANPELRVLLILADALGLELVILILAIQLRGWLPAICVVLSACSRYCEVPFLSFEVSCACLGRCCRAGPCQRSADSGAHL
jgi:hypothetical protein